MARTYADMPTNYYFQAKKYPTMRLFNCIIESEDAIHYHVYQRAYHMSLPKDFWELVPVTGGLNWAEVIV